MSFTITIAFVLLLYLLQASTLQDKKKRFAAAAYSKENRARVYVMPVSSMDAFLGDVSLYCFYDLTIRFSVQIATVYSSLHKGKQSHYSSYYSSMNLHNYNIWAKLYLKTI